MFANRVLFEDPHNAARATRLLDQSDTVDDPLEEYVADGPILPHHYSVSFSQARSGAILGGVMTAVVGAVASAMVMGAGDIPISMGIAALAGAIGGGLYGAVLGALAGSTEPSRALRTLRRCMNSQQAAILARFETARDKERAEQLLLASPGARSSV